MTTSDNEKYINELKQLSDAEGIEIVTELFAGWLSSDLAEGLDANRRANRFYYYNIIHNLQISLNKDHTYVTDEPRNSHAGAATRFSATEA